MRTFFLFMFILVSLVNNAQFENIFASEGDAGKYVTSYISPFFDGLMNSSSAGWSNTAKPLEPFNFSIDLGVSGSFISNNVKQFTFDNNNYDYLQIDSGSNVLPTVVGDKSQTRMKIVIPINGIEHKVLKFDAVDGIADRLPYNVIPLPKVQLNMGLPLGSEISLRYFPKTEFSNKVYASIFGIGIKHSLSQYFTRDFNVKDELSEQHFNLAVQASFERIGVGTTNTSNDKNVKMTLGTINMQALGSFNYKLLTIYSALGYSIGNSTLDVKGTYEYTYDVQDNNSNHIRYNTIQVVDPLLLKFSTNGYRATLGIRLNLIYFRIFADYTLQNLPTANIGIEYKI